MFRKIAIAAVVVGALAVGSTAQAGIIAYSTINFTGSMTTNPSDLATATEISLFSGGETGFGHTGSFVTIPHGLSVAFTPFAFAPGSVLPVSPIWTFDYDSVTYSFVLESVSSQVFFPGLGQTFLFLSGQGTLTIGGESTRAAFSLTTQSGAGPTPEYTFSAATTAVPEPATLGLLGMGLLGLGARARRRRKI